MSDSTNLLHEIWAAIGRKRTRLFRNNVGLAWTGDVTKHGTTVIIKNARPLHAGLCAGSSDLIGYTTVIVTPNMVGHALAVFTAIEVKSGSGRATESQKQFICNVKQAGGFAGIARSEEDAELIVKGRL